MLCRLRSSCAIKLTKLFRSKSTKKAMENVEGVFVRCIPDEEIMQITINFPTDTGNIKTINMNRFQTEELGKTMERLKANILKKISSKKRREKKKKSELGEQIPEDPVLKIWMTINDLIVDNESTPINQTFVEGAVLHLEDKMLPVEINLPKVIALVLPQNIMVGFPIYPMVQVEFCDLENAKFTWYRYKTVEEETAKGKKKTVEVCEKIAETFSCMPTADDIGYKLKLSCVPQLAGRVGAEFSILSKCEVDAGPGLCPFENRHSFTQSITDDKKIRVVSYNILADIYADSDFTRTELFPYCPPYALAIDYRIQLLLKEIAGYNSDIICLQEVDRKVFNHELISAFDVLGYNGSLQVKAGSQEEGPDSPEGEAIFFRRSKFRQIEDDSIAIRQIFNDGNEKYADIKTIVATNDTLKTEITDRGTIAQVLILESVINPKCRLCVANTHLFFHPKACCVRSLQTVTIIRHLEYVLQKQRDQGYDVSLIFCGDFNCSPKGGAYEFITKKCIGEDNYSWSNNTDFKLEGATFFHSLNLRSGCGELPYTNYAKHFQEQLDYIFLDSSFEVEQVVPMPEHKEVSQHIALPSVVFPSDHIAQICDIRWKSLD